MTISYIWIRDTLPETLNIIEKIGGAAAVVGALKASNVFHRLLLTEEQLLAGYDTLLEETGAL